MHQVNPAEERDLSGTLPKTTTFSCPLEMQNQVQNYPWGKVGSQSIISTLTGNNSEAPMAELWMGAHPKAPSKVLIDGDGTLPLDKVIAENPEAILGPKVLAEFGPTLPFLFKVLSVGAPLSIQAHPDKELAKKLHQKDPANYPDDNHKPEVAIAITPVEALCGFRPLKDIKAACRITPELVELLGDALHSKINDFEKHDKATLLKEIYSRVMTSDVGTVTKLCKDLYNRLSQVSELEDLHPEEQWIVELSKSYPEGDVGIFSFYLLNLIKLKPGEGVFLKANTPHAYLSGDMVECMANSDNVVRAGLTPKHKDIPTLLDMLEYVPATNLVIVPSPNQDGQNAEGQCNTFNLPVNEFVVDILNSDGTNAPHSTEKSTRNSHTTDNKVELLFVSEGSATVETRATGSQTTKQTLKAGESILIPATIGEYTINWSDRDQSNKGGSIGTLFRIRVP